MKTDDRTTPWLVRYKASPRARLRLFCFPYAGGAAYVFRQWPHFLPDFIDVCAVQPPGHCPLTALGGLQDEELKRESVAPWGEYTTASFSLHMLPGGHFFLHSSQGALLEILARELEGASRS